MCYCTNAHADVRPTNLIDLDLAEIESSRKVSVPLPRPAPPTQSKAGGGQ
jgi:hypothetical protein